MEVLAERNPAVDRLKIFEDFFSQDPMAIRNYVINERAKADIKYIREYDRQEARAEGVAEGQKEAARSLRAQGILTDEQIAEALNMPLETVKAL